jgi:hypothetical protein
MGKVVGSGHLGVLGPWKWWRVIKGVGGNEEDYELCAVMGKVSGEKGI